MVYNNSATIKIFALKNCINYTNIDIWHLSSGTFMSTCLHDVLKNTYGRCNNDILNITTMIQSDFTKW